MSDSLRLRRWSTALATAVLVYAGTGLVAAGLGPGGDAALSLGLVACAVLGGLYLPRPAALGVATLAIATTLPGLWQSLAQPGSGWLAVAWPRWVHPASDGLVLPSALAMLALALAAGIRAAWPHRGRTGIALLMVLPVAMPPFALAALLMEGPEQAPWQRVTELPIFLAVAQGTLAVALALHGGGKPDEGRVTQGSAADLLVIGALVAGLLLWRALVIDAEQSALELQRTELNQLGGRLRSSLKAFIRPIARSAERWNVMGGTPEAVWRSSAGALLRDIPGLTSLQWLDRDGVVRWVEPMPDTAQRVGTRPNQDPLRQALLAQAHADRVPVFSEPVALLQGGLGMLLFAPLEAGEGGTLVAVLRLAPRFRNVIELSTDNPGLAVGYREQFVYTGATFPQDADLRAGRLIQQPVGPSLPGWWLAAVAPVPTPGLLRLAHLSLGLATASLLLLHLALLWWHNSLRREQALAEAGEALGEANRRFAMANRVARIGVWEWSRDHGELILDEQTREIFGAVGDPRPALRIVAQCLPAAGRRQLAAAVREAARGTGVLEVDLPARRLDGTGIDLHVTARPLMHPGHRAGRLLGVVADVTERLRLERLKSAFVSTVSHELRTPLTAISGSLAMLDAGAVGALPPMARQLVTVSRQNTTRLALLIDDLLDLERLAAGGLPLALQPVALAVELDRALSLNRGYAEGLEVALERSGDPVDIDVRADPARLQQVLSNLLSNAAKFSTAGTVVELRAGQLGDRVRVEVLDRGCGVPEAFLPRLFSRFSQADGSDTRRHSGTGLGLAICSELVSRMGGTIGYTPREGGGSCFWFTLPRAEVSG